MRKRSTDIDNRPGGSAAVGSELVAKAPADGYTLLTIAVEFTINPILRKLSFDPIRDFTCVSEAHPGGHRTLGAGGESGRGNGRLRRRPYRTGSQQHVNSSAYSLVQIFCLSRNASRI